MERGRTERKLRKMMLKKDPAGIFVSIKVQQCDSPEDALNVLARHEARVKKLAFIANPEATADYYPTCPGITHAA
ncbi:hypothetical protein WG66_000420 [Moniliophthora roreri]|nr:hypothetical protein WG66_000420 [Moniliophthora roreri]